MSEIKPIKAADVRLIDRVLEMYIAFKESCEKTNGHTTMTSILLSKNASNTERLVLAQMMKNGMYRNDSECCRKPKYTGFLRAERIHVRLAVDEVRAQHAEYCLAKKNKPEISPEMNHGIEMESTAIQEINATEAQAHANNASPELIIPKKRKKRTPKPKPKFLIVLFGKQIFPRK